MESHKDKETKGVRAIMILEIIGKPAEHLVETLKDLIKKMDSEEYVEVKTNKIHEPVLMKDQKDFYTTFAEVEVEVEEIAYLVILMFKYMPANVEIVYPELIALTNIGWSDILSEITRRLHGYDEVARILTAEKNILEKKFKEALNEKKEEKKQEK